MALHGLLGDLHGNLHALEAVIAALDRQGVARIACVGDLVGYNADPDACVDLLEARGALCIAGNHDLIATGRLGFERCSNKAMHALARTRTTLSDATVRRLATLPAHRRLGVRTLLTHGGVRDVQQYVTRADHARENARHLEADFPGVRVCIFGHTHEQRVFVVRGDRVEEPFVEAIATGAPVRLPQDALCFVNPGSVDAARKHGPRVAEYAVFDPESAVVCFGRVPYAHAASEARALAGGYRISRLRERLIDWRRRLRRAAPVAEPEPMR